MTTREAVDNLCTFTCDMHTSIFDEDDRFCVAVKLLCEQYGLKLSDYFTNV